MDEDVVVEEVALGDGRVLRLARPRDPDALLTDEALDADERMPYWAQLWPSGVVLARAVAARRLTGLPVLDLGCGLGTVALAAAAGGARVLAVDWSDEALDATRDNASRNGVEVELLRADWKVDAPSLAQRGPWPLALAADVLYERRDVAPLLELLDAVVARDGEAWIADPGRPPAAAFLDGARALGFAVLTRPAAAPPRPSVHRLRRLR